MRLRPNRVFYDAPPPYSGKGRPRFHGAKFKLNDSTTWWTPDETVDVDNPEMERLSIRLWCNLHFQQSKTHGMNLIQVQRLDESGNPKHKSLWDHAESWGDGVIKLLDWMYEAVAHFPKSIGTISRWFGEVVGYFDQKTSNGAVEGINNKLKLIKRLGYGFRNFENFRFRALLPWYFNPISP